VTGPARRAQRGARLLLGLNAVILAVTGEEPRLLTVNAGDPGAAGVGRRRTPAAGSRLEALPFGPLDPDEDRTLELRMRQLVQEQAGLSLGYVEQLYTFGDRDRAHRSAGTREISVAYLALVRETHVAGAAQAQWRNWYEFFPWEDWREGRPPAIDRAIGPALQKWASGAGTTGERRARRERIDITFGLAGAPWDRLRVLERYELLYEAGLVEEAARDAAAAGRRATRGRAAQPDGPAPAGFDAHVGRAMALDHRRILATALARLRGKLQYRPVVFELLPAHFTLLQLQRLVEGLAGVRLHKQNFRRLVERGGLVEGTGQVDEHTGGRPAELFRFRREVLRERRAPGLWLPDSGTAG
jgi:hypothetical protein